MPAKTFESKTIRFLLHGCFADQRGWVRVSFNLTVSFVLFPGLGQVGDICYASITYEYKLAGRV